MGQALREYWTPEEGERFDRLFALANVLLEDKDQLSAAASPTLPMPGGLLVAIDRLLEEIKEERQRLLNLARARRAEAMSNKGTMGDARG